MQLKVFIIEVTKALLWIGVGAIAKDYENGLINFYVVEKGYC
jgi:hypothetical protein